MGDGAEWLEALQGACNGLRGKSIKKCRRCQHKSKVAMCSGALGQKEVCE